MCKIGSFFSLPSSLFKLLVTDFSSSTTTTRATESLSSLVCSRTTLYSTTVTGARSTFLHNPLPFLLTAVCCHHHAMLFAPVPTKNGSREHEQKYISVPAKYYDAFFFASFSFCLRKGERCGEIEASVHQQHHYQHSIYFWMRKGKKANETR